VLTELPFGNVVTTVSLNGDELKAMLENGVSQMPGIAGRFPQVSGLCFTYDITENPGSRVVSAVLADPDGTCTTTPIDLTASGGPYKIAENDFMASGGDGYPVTNTKPGYATQDFMDQVLADHLTANDPVSPFVNGPPDGRVNCIVGGGPLASNVCPTVTPSP
jgi:2',3'-cyclic-nucleotide 2'-phosphodiesterase (5'-nucleotidase family)